MMNQPNYINFSNLPWIEEQQKLFQENPSQLEPTWRSFFEGLTLASSSDASPDALKTYLLIEAYRRFGHMGAKTNPFSQTPSSYDPLALSHFGFTASDEEKLVPSFSFFPEANVPLKELVAKLKSIYCGSIGYEYKDCPNLELQKWLQDALEKDGSLSSIDETRVFGFLAEAEAFEFFLHTKYPGQKRFSLEGCETLIPILDEIFQLSSNYGTEEAILGMAHRGRLNVLANVLGKDRGQIFKEFEENYAPDEEGSGDVKYHKGFQGSFHTLENKPFTLTLAANPSHLESVDPVVEGMSRARQAFWKSKTKVLPLLIHGDASIAGQGVVYETLQLSNLEGYATAGTIHIVINNQIGFTAIPEETRSTRYCTDIAKSFGFVVFHVNAEDVLACAKVAHLAAYLRFRFNTDVFIDLIGYRRWGHNEGDEPSYTQPLRYAIIRDKSSILDIFKKQLVEKGFSEEALQSIYEASLSNLRKTHENLPSSTPIPAHKSSSSEVSSLSKERLRQLAHLITTAPEDFSVNEKLKRLLKERLSSLETKIDWGFAEQLSLASLLNEGICIRFSGQDSQRGTFSQRHAVLVDQKNESRFNLLSAASKNGSTVEILNSSLSEFAVMGFELGFSLAAPNTLVLWEAQFGDFANGAQIIIDQYLSSGEQKWGQRSNLTLLLPHGYEGQGPEHSSARLERFLQLCAQNNLCIIVPSNPAQYFHALRRQATSFVPCVIFTPKALLRYSDSFSVADAFTEEKFEALIEDAEDSSHQAEHLILCSGKIFYELSLERSKREKKRSAIIRIEQLYPLNKDTLKEWISRRKNLRRVSWVQEEPENMGASRFLMPELQQIVPSSVKLDSICRKQSASTAAGSHALHKKELLELLDNVFNN